MDIKKVKCFDLGIGLLAFTFFLLSSPALAALEAFYLSVGIEVEDCQRGNTIVCDVYREEMQPVKVAVHETGYGFAEFTRELNDGRFALYISVERLNAETHRLHFSQKAEIASRSGQAVWRHSSVTLQNGEILNRLLVENAEIAGKVNGSFYRSRVYIQPDSDYSEM